MLNESEFKFPEQEKTIYLPMPSGMYQIQLTDIEEKDGLDFKGNPNKQLLFTFVVLDEGEFYGRMLWRQTSMKMSGGTKPSNLYTVLCGLENKDFSKEECQDSHNWLTASYLNGLIGKQYLGAVSQKAKLDGTPKNVLDSIMPVKEELPAYDPEKRVKAE